MISTQASRKAAGAIAVLWLSSLAGGASTFLAQVSLSRYLGPEPYGRLSAALATVMFFFPVAGFGVAQYWLRVFGLEGWQGRRWLAPSVRLVSLSTAVSLFILLVWSRVSGQDPTTRQLVLWLSPLVASQAVIDLVSGRFQLEERYQALAVWQAALPCSRLIVVIVGIAVSARLGLVVGGFVAAALILTAIAGPTLAKTLNGQLRLAGHGAGADGSLAEIASPSLRDVLAGAWPFALSGVFYLTYFQSAVIMLEWMSGAAAAAVFNVATVILVAVYLLPVAIYQKYLMPKLQRWAEHDKEHMLAVYRLGNGSMLVAGSVVMVLLWLAGPAGVNLLFGQEYASAGKLLRILAIGVPARFLATSVGGVLATQDNMRRKVWYQSAVAVINVILNAVVIPRFSYWGAAATTVVSEVAILAVYLFGVRRHVFGKDAMRGWNLSVRSLQR